MGDTAYERITAALTGHGCKVRDTGSRATAQCPAHKDRDPSLSVTGIEGQALVYCHGGCDTVDVLAALDLDMADLYDERKGATYRYDSGRIVHRTPAKKFRQSGDLTKVELYHLSRLTEAGPGAVFLVEGEKDVHAIEAAGGIATTAPQGAANFGKVDVEPLRGRHVTAVVDRDTAGSKWAVVVAKRLAGVVAPGGLRFVQATTGKDAADHIAAGHNLTDWSAYASADEQLLDALAAVDLGVATGPKPVPWEEPLPLGWHVNAPAFPTDVLPPVIRRYVLALAEATQTPADLPGTVALGVFSASIGGRVDVQCPTWVEPTNLFGVPVLPPASRKSAVVAACRAPLAEAERQLRDSIGDQVHDSQTEAEILAKRAEAAKAKAAKSGEPDDLVDAQELVRAAEDARQRIVAWPRLSTVDATPEALVSLLAEQGGRIAAISAEAGVFASLTGRYAKAPNLDPVLMAHAGDAITIDRRSRVPEHVEHPALTIVASIQPYALREMVDRDDFAGRGLLARVLWSMPVDNAGYRKVRDVNPVPEAVNAAYRTLVVDLAVWAGTQSATTLLKLDDDATEVLLSYAEQVEKLLRPTGVLGEYRLTREWGGKLVGAVARIAGCLHAAGHGVDGLGEPINEATMRAAVALGEYYRQHAVLALTPGDDKRTETARTLLVHLVDKGKTTVTVRDLCRTGPKALRKADTLARLLTYLAELGWVRESGTATGYEVHPEASQHLHRGDTGDTGDSGGESAGHATYTPPPQGVAPTGDNGRHVPDRRESHADLSPPVAPTGDTLAAGVTQAMSRGNAGGVAPVAPVAPPAIDYCRKCGMPLPRHTNSCPTTKETAA